MSGVYDMANLNSSNTTQVVSIIIVVIRLYIVAQNDL